MVTSPPLVPGHSSSWKVMMHSFFFFHLAKRGTAVVSGFCAHVCTLSLSDFCISLTTNLAHQFLLTRTKKTMTHCTMIGRDHMFNFPRYWIHASPQINRLLKVKNELIIYKICCLHAFLHLNRHIVVLCYRHCRTCALVLTGLPCLIACQHIITEVEHYRNE